MNFQNIKGDKLKMKYFRWNCALSKERLPAPNWLIDLKLRRVHKSERSLVSVNSFTSFLPKRPPKSDRDRLLGFSGPKKSGERKAEGSGLLEARTADPLLEQSGPSSYVLMILHFAQFEHHTIFILQFSLERLWTDFQSTWRLTGCLIWYWRLYWCDSDWWFLWRGY